MTGKITEYSRDDEVREELTTKIAKTIQNKIDVLDGEIIRQERLVEALKNQRDGLFRAKAVVVQHGMIK